MATRRELIEKLRERYRKGALAVKKVILDELVAVTGYHRKHAIRVLQKYLPPDSGAPRRRRWRLYGPEIKAAIIVLWEASDRICGKRLKPLVAVLLPALERHAQLRLNETDRQLVLQASASTLDRLLSDVRVIASGGASRRAGFSSGSASCADPDICRLE